MSSHQSNPQQPYAAYHGYSNDLQLAEPRRPNFSDILANSTPASASSNPLDISYSTMSPRNESATAYPMHIKLNLIDQTPSFSSESSCESPFPMTPTTPQTPNDSFSGNCNDLSKKQRHNLREQRRILRISKQFEMLRQKLEVAGYSLSKKDKYSVLQATLEYLTTLENQQKDAGTVKSEQSSSNDMSTQSTSTPMQPPPLHKGTPSSNTTIGIPYMIDNLPSPVPSLANNFPLDFASFPPLPSESSPRVDTIDGSSATYRDTFTNGSMPSLVAKLDGTILEANMLFLELCGKNLEEVRLHSLYTMCTSDDAPKMYGIVNKVLACEAASAQCKMMWHLSRSGSRKVFVSVAMVYDGLHRPANLHCSLLPLS